MTEEGMDPENDPELQELLRQLDATASRERELRAMAEAEDEDPAFDALIASTVTQLAGQAVRKERSSGANRWLFGGFLAAAAAVLIWMIMSGDGDRPNPGSGGASDDNSRTLSGGGRLTQLAIDGDLTTGLTLNWSAPKGALVEVGIFDPETNESACARPMMAGSSWELTSEELAAVKPHHHWYIELDRQRLSSPLFP